MFIFIFFRNFYRFLGVFFVFMLCYLVFRYDLYFSYVVIVFVQIFFFVCCKLQGSLVTRLGWEGWVQFWGRVFQGLKKFCCFRLGFYEGGGRGFLVVLVFGFGVGSFGGQQWSRVKYSVIFSCSVGYVGYRVENYVVYFRC